MSNAANIQSILDSLPYTAPECKAVLMVGLMRAVDGLLRENGWKPEGLFVKLPEGVTFEQAQAAVDALGYPTLRATSPEDHGSSDPQSPACSTDSHR